MEILQAGFANGSIIDWIVAILVMEGVVLLLLRQRARIPLNFVDVLAGLGAGAALLLALRSALRGSPWQFIAAWLMLGGVAHAVDMSRRIRRC